MNNDYTDFEVWQECRKCANHSYGSTKSFPKEEQFGLTNQIRRAAVSVSLNIAEGCGWQTTKYTSNFLPISRGSFHELETQRFITIDRKYSSKEQFDVIFNNFQSGKRLLNGFIN